MAPILLSPAFADIDREGGNDDTGFHPPLSAPAREDDMMRAAVAL
jgi:hypothetical protein